MEGIMRYLIVIIGLFILASPVLAVDEIFTVQTKGTAYCNDFVSTKWQVGEGALFYLWILGEEPTEILGSATPEFDLAIEDGTFYMLGQNYKTEERKGVFVAGSSIEAPVPSLNEFVEIDASKTEFYTMRGTWWRDVNGRIIRMKAKLTEFSDGCYVVYKFDSSEVEFFE